LILEGGEVEDGAGQRGDAQVFAQRRFGGVERLDAVKRDAERGAGHARGNQHLDGEAEKAKSP
jgi:hypothetical protein